MKNLTSEGYDSESEDDSENEDEKKVPTRVSYTNVDLIMSKILPKIFPYVDGWFIPKSEYGEEICLFDPYNTTKMIKHEYYDYKKLKRLIDLCENSDNVLDCKNNISASFRDNKIVCIHKKATDTIQCFLLTELANMPLSKEKIDSIAEKVKKGETTIEVR